MLAEHDGLVETEALLPRFDRAFPNPKSRILWYGEERFAKGLSERVRVLSESVPQMRVASFSHMGLMHRPDNPQYGEAGADRFCWNGQSQADSKACEAGADIWYSGERHQPDEAHNYARAHLQSLVRRAARRDPGRDGAVKARLSSTDPTSACNLFQWVSLRFSLRCRRLHDKPIY